MGDPGDQEHSLLDRVIGKRVEKKGLRPRVAASIIAVLWLIAIVVFGIVEHLIDPDTFDTIWLGMWWATQTVTTVGYGDVVPGEAAGQFIAAVLMIGGLSLFAVVTGVITSAFVARAQAERRADREDPVMAKLEQMAGRSRRSRPIWRVCSAGVTRAARRRQSSPPALEGVTLASRSRACAASPTARRVRPRRRRSARSGSGRRSG